MRKSGIRDEWSRHLDTGLNLLHRFGRWILRNAKLILAIPLTAAVAAVGIQTPGILADWAGVATGTVFRSIDWFYLLLTTGILILCAWLAFGRYGGVRLGQTNEKPEFSTGSWLSMLFAAGMGSGLLYWGVAEPILHYANAPGVARETSEAARHAMAVTLFHWCLHGWSIFCLAALALAYFGFRRKTPYLPGACLKSAFSGRWVAPTAWCADFIAIIAVVLGVGGSLAMGVSQLERGSRLVAEFDFTTLELSGLIFGILLLSYLPALALPLNKGIKWVSNANIILAIVLLGYIWVIGPTAFLARNILTAFGDYTTQIVPLSFELFPFETDEVTDWLRSWTLTYFIWVMAWAPFVGIFIARISRGRTIREFIAGVLIVPSVFSIIWFTVFGGTALYEERFGLSGLVAYVRNDVSTALFAVFERLPNTELLSIVAIILAFVFLVTSVISAAYVLGMLGEHGSLNPSSWIKIAWGILLAFLGAAMMLSGDIEAVRSVTIVGAIPFAFVLVLQIIALLNALAKDSRIDIDPVTAAQGFSRGGTGEAATPEIETPEIETPEIETPENPKPENKAVQE